MDVYLEIAASINKDIDKLLLSVLSGSDERFVYKDKYIRWRRVQKAIHGIVEYHLTEVE